jgi:hypothetical protein
MLAIINDISTRQIILMMLVTFVAIGAGWATVKYVGSNVGGILLLIFIIVVTFLVLLSMLGVL